MKLSVSSSSSQEIALDKNVASSALSVASSRLSAIRDSLANINNGRRLSYEYTQQTPITTPTPSLPSSLLLTAFKMHNKLRRRKSDDGAHGELLLDDFMDEEDDDVQEEYDAPIDNTDAHNTPGQKFVQFVPSLNNMGAIMAFLGSEARRDDGEDVNIMYMHAFPVLATKTSSACTQVSVSIEEEDADDTMSTELDEVDVPVDDTFMTRDVMLQVARNDIHIDADFTSQDTDLQPLEPEVLNSSTPAEEMSSGRPLSATSEPTRQQETELLLQPQPEIKSTSISKQIQAQLGFVAYETHAAGMQRMRRIEKTRSTSSTIRLRSDKNNKSNSKKKDSLKSEADASQQQRRLKKITKLTMKNAKKKDVTPIAAAPLDHPLCHSTFATSA